MAVLMLLFMQHMYDNASLYIVIAIASTPYSASLCSSC